MRKKKIRFAIGQINCTVGDFAGNCRKITEYTARARQAGAEIIAFPELAITGYPPEDLLLKHHFIDDGLAALERLAQGVREIVVVAGFVDKDKDGIYNAAAVIANGKVRGVYRKIFLPNYGVFDEKRYFKAGTASPIFKAGDLLFGVTICEDIWHGNGPTRSEAEAGAHLIVNINASPYHLGKIKEREDAVTKQAKNNKAHIAYINLVGGQDELVFDGQSMIVNDAGKVVARLEAFTEALLLADLDIAEGGRGRPGKAIVVADTPSPAQPKPALPHRTVTRPEPVAETYQALLLGLKDYVAKNGFTKVVIGMSGGIDSSLVATIAADALGREHVTGIFMQSRYSSPASARDAQAVAENLGIKLIALSIEHIFKIYLLTFEPHFVGSSRDITEENLQARIRGNILMAFSNKFGWLVLTTGNKSEMSTGYATLYGDMAGGFAVIKDVTKALVYKLARYRNGITKVIPTSVLTKEPTAELRHDQKDRDTLPPYDVLDKILKAYVEEDKDIDDIIAVGFDAETVRKTATMVDRSEYKRRQSPPGIKITPKAFGRDRRMPITNKYRG